MRFTLVAWLVFASALGARAEGGVLEINQTCAEQTGCFAGDPAGFPVDITASGSYRLTSNLVVSNAATTAIRIGASNVSLDLGGFAIRGPVSCSGSPVVCTPAFGGGHGVLAQTELAVTVFNGSVSGMGGIGVSLFDRSVVRGMRIHSNAARGIVVGYRSIVAENAVEENGAAGIDAGHGTKIEGNVLARNAGAGIVAGDAARVAGNTISENGGYGVLVDRGTTVSGNVIRGNGLSGIFAGQSSVLAGNTVSVNLGRGIQAGYLAQIVDNGLDGNAGIGIEANDGSNIARNTIGAITPGFVGQPGIDCKVGCSVHDNVVRNTSRALSLGSESRYGRNVFSLSSSPVVAGSGVSAGDNLCNGASC